MIYPKKLKEGDTIFNERFHSRYTIREIYHNSVSVYREDDTRTSISGDTFDSYMTKEEYSEKYPEYLL